VVSVPNMSSANQNLLVHERRWHGAEDEHVSLNVMKAPGWGV
jgi:hypothetical protein